MAKDKTYINMCKIKEVKFDNGGSVMNADFKVSELAEHENENGWVKITIAERRVPSEKGATHYAYVNDFVPSSGGKTYNNNVSSKMEDDDLPF